MFGVVGILIEYFLVIFLPIALLLSYLYIASLRATLLGSSRAFKLSVLLGVMLVWLAAIPGPLVFLGAYLTSSFLVFLAWWPKFRKREKLLNTLKSTISYLKAIRVYFNEGCTSLLGCLLRFTAAWPAVATLASTLQGFLAPIVMFIIGYIININIKVPAVGILDGNPELANKLIKLLRVIMALVAWGFAIMNILHNLLTPQWLLIQEYIITGKVSKLPLSARLLAMLFGKTAAYIYGVMVVALALYTALRIYQLIAESIESPYVIVALSPLVGYAIAANKLGEPLTSIGYAVGMSVALRFPSLARLGDFFAKTEIFIDKIGKLIVEYEVPLGPLGKLLGVKEP